MRFEVWAPTPERVELVIGAARHEMRSVAGRPGWLEAEVVDARPGARYGYSLDGGPVRPDPRSASQPEGIDGLSEVVDHGAFAWTDSAWRGIPLSSAVIYELHVGTFTDAGTFDAAIEKLPHLRRSRRRRDRAAAGRRVLRPTGLGLRRRRPVLAPSGLRRPGRAQAAGRRLPRRRPRRHHGRRLQPPRAGRELPRRVRSVLHRPVRHAVGHGREPRRSRQRRGAPLLSRQRASRGCATTTATASASTPSTPSSTPPPPTSSRSWPWRSRPCRASTGRPLFLIAESDLNDPRIVARREVGGYGMDAQWSDDFHHTLHAALTGERSGYYGDFGSLEQLATALRAGVRLRRRLRPGPRPAPRPAVPSASRGGASSGTCRTTTRSATGPRASGPRTCCRPSA